MDTARMLNKGTNVTLTRNRLIPRDGSADTLHLRELAVGIMSATGPRMMPKHMHKVYQLLPRESVGSLL